MKTKGYAIFFWRGGKEGAKKGTRSPVSHDCIAGSVIQIIGVTNDIGFQLIVGSGPFSFLSSLSIFSLLSAYGKS